MLPPNEWVEFPSPLDRYYYIEEAAEGQYVHRHLNGILILGLAKTHELRTTSSLLKVEFDPVVLRTVSEISGKRKKGGTLISKGDLICTVTTEDGVEHRVVSGIEGKPIEVNTLLEKSPNLIQSDGDNSGYLVMMSTK